MVKKFALSSILGVLTVSSAFAADVPKLSASPHSGTNTLVEIYGVTSIGLETPLAASGAQSAPVHTISGHGAIMYCSSWECLGNGELITVTFDESVTDKNLTAQRSFGACRRAIESAGPKARITLRGDFIDAGPSLLSRMLIFSTLTSCWVSR